MSTLLKECARHLHDLTEYNPAHVAVMMIDADGTTQSFFYGDTEGAAKALTFLPEAAKAACGQSCVRSRHYVPATAIFR